VGALFSCVLVLTFVIEGLTGHGSVRMVVSSLLAAVFFFMAIRGFRSGYLAVTDSTVTVRTVYRTRKFDLSQIVSVRPVSSTQVTRRVFPVISFTNGGAYKLSEFFQQRRRYDENPQDGLVAEAIEAIIHRRT
jgi:hypothetical protein